MVSTRKCPVFFDLVTDRVRSRALQVAGVLFVVQVVFFLVGPRLLLDPRASLPNRGSVIDLFSHPRGSSIGTPFSNPALLRVLAGSRPVQGMGVRLRVASIKTTALQGELVCFDQERELSSFHSAARNLVCDAALTAEDGLRVSSVVGLADFSDVFIRAGVVGMYRLEFSLFGGMRQDVAPSSEATTSTFVRISSAMTRMSISSSLPPVLSTGKPMGSLSVSVAGAAPNSTLFLACDNLYLPQWLVSLYRPSYNSPQTCILSSSTALVDENGVATFSDVIVNASIGRFISFFVIADWMVSPVLAGPSRMFVLATRVTSLQIVGGTNGSVVDEVTPFSSFGSSVVPVVRVLDAQGHPVVGVVVYAQVATQADGKSPMPQVESFVDLEIGRKEIYNSISLPTDSSGQTSFPSAGFSSAGRAGTYRVRFICEGVVSSQTLSFQVRTQVLALSVSLYPRVPQNWSVALLTLGQMFSPFVTFTGPAEGKNVRFISGKRVGLISQDQTPAGPRSGAAIELFPLWTDRSTNETLIFDTVQVEVDGVVTNFDIAVDVMGTNPSLCIGYEPVDQSVYFSASSGGFAAFRVVTLGGEGVPGLMVNMTFSGNLPLNCTVPPVVSDANGIANFSVTGCSGVSQPVTITVQEVVDNGGSKKCAGLTPVVFTNFIQDIETRVRLLESVAVNSSAWRLSFDCGLCTYGMDLQLLSAPFVPSMRSDSFVSISRLNVSSFLVVFQTGARGNFSFFGLSNSVTSDLVTVSLSDTVGSLEIVVAAGGSSPTVGAVLSTQPVVRVLNAAGAPLEGIRVMVDNPTTYVAGVLLGPMNASPPFDVSGVLVSAPSNATGHAVFSQLATFSTNASTLCFSSSFANDAAVDLEFLGAYGQNGYVVASKTVCQPFPKTSPSTTEMKGIFSGDKFVSLNSPFSPGQLLSSPQRFWTLSAVNRKTRKEAALTPFRFYATTTGVFDLPNVTVWSGDAGVYDLLLDGGFSMGQITLMMVPQKLKLELDVGLMMNNIQAVGRFCTVGLDTINVVVRAMLNDGTPVNAAPVGVMIESGEGGAIRDAVNVTQEMIYLTPYSYYMGGGVAGFWIDFVKLSKPGQNFTFRIFALEDPSVYVITSPLMVKNLVGSVTYVRQPKGLGRMLFVGNDIMVVSDDEVAARNSVGNPVVIIKDAFGNELFGAIVPDMRVVNVDTNQSAIVVFDYIMTKDNELHFYNTRIVSAVTGTYYMIVSAQGIDSVASDTFLVVDTNSPQVSNFDNLELFLGVCLLGAIPIMVFNSKRIANKCVMVISYLLGLIVLAMAVGFVGFVAITPDMLLGAKSDSLVAVQVGVTLAVLIVTLLIFCATGIARCCNARDAEERGMDLYKKHVRLLMAEVTDAKLLAEAEKKEERKRLQLLNQQARKAWSEQPGQTWYMQAMRLLWVQAVDVAIMARDDYILDVTYFDYHKHLRTNLRFSSRFLITIGVSILTIVVASLFCVVIVLSLVQALTEAKIALATLEANVMRSDVGQALSALSQTEVIEGAGFGGLIAQAFDFAAPLLDGAPIPSNFTDFGSAMVYLSDSVSVAMADRLTFTGLIATCLSAVYCLLVVLSLVYVYRLHMFKARDGTLFASNQFNRADQRPTAASELPGIMFSHVLLGNLLFFAVLWGVMFLFSFSVVRQVVVDSTGKLILTLFTINIVWGIIHFLFSVVIRKNHFIRDLFVFSIFDFVETFLSIASSAALAIVRIIIAMAANVLLFITPVVPMLGWTPTILVDFSFKSWRGLILNDSIHLNPVVNVFVDALKNPVDLPEESAKLRQVRRMFWRAVCKARFGPQHFTARVADVKMPRERNSMMMTSISINNDDDSNGNDNNIDIKYGSDDDDYYEGRPLLELHSQV